MLLIQLLQQVQLLSLNRRRHLAWTAQVQNRITHRSKERSLVGRRQKTAGPVGLAADWTTAFVQNHHVTRQTLVRCAHSVGTPGAKAGATDKGLARIHRHECGTVGMAVRMAGTDHCQFVCMFAYARKVVGNHQAALTTRPEGAKRRSEKTDTTTTGIDVLPPRREWLAGVFLKCRLVVKSINLAGSTVHHQKDAGFRLRREMCGARTERTGGRSMDGAERCTLRGSRRTQNKPVLLKQPCQGHSGKAVTHLPDQFTARNDGGHEMVGGCSGMWVTGVSGTLVT